MSLPNLLTLGRIVAVPFICWLLLVEGTTVRWLAMILFVLAAITDFFDGYLARRSGQTSALGRMLDPIADKLLVAALLLVLAFDGTFNALDLALAILITLREVFVSGLREFAGSANITIHVSMLAKYKTTLQLIALAALIAIPLFPAIELVAKLLFALSAVLTAYTGIDYLRATWPLMKDDRQ